MRSAQESSTHPQDGQEFIPSLVRMEELSQEGSGRETGHLRSSRRRHSDGKTCRRIALAMLITKPRNDFFSTGVSVHLIAAPGSGALI
jgi:hypothetical protein